MEEIEGGQVLDVNEIIFQRGLSREDLVTLQINAIREGINNIVTEADIEKVKRMLKALEILQYGKLEGVKKDLEKLNTDYKTEKEKAANESEELTAEMNFIFNKFSWLIESTIKRGKFSDIEAAWDLTVQERKKENANYRPKK